jgi:hypothetical protein
VSGPPLLQIAVAATSSRIWYQASFAGPAGPAASQAIVARRARAGPVLV